MTRMIVGVLLGVTVVCVAMAQESSPDAAASSGASPGASPVAARPLKMWTGSMEEARHFADSLMQKMGNDEMAGAFEIIAENLPLAPNDMRQLQAKAMEMRAQASAAGKLVGSQYVRRELVADVFMRLTYVQKFERTGVVWHIIFYKPQERWQLHGFQWQANPGVLFDQPASG